MYNTNNYYHNLTLYSNLMYYQHTKSFYYSYMIEWYMNILSFAVIGSL